MSYRRDKHWSQNFRMEKSSLNTKTQNMYHNFAQWKIVFFCRKNSSQNATLKAKSSAIWLGTQVLDSKLCQLLCTLSTVWKTQLALFWWGNLLTHLRAESDSSLPVEGDAIQLLCYIKIWALNLSPLNAFSWALLQCSALNGKEKPKEILQKPRPLLGSIVFLLLLLRCIVCPLVVLDWAQSRAHTSPALCHRAAFLDTILHFNTTREHPFFAHSTIGILLYLKNLVPMFDFLVSQRGGGVLLLLEREPRAPRHAGQVLYYWAAPHPGKALPMSCWAAFHTLSSRQLLEDSPAFVLSNSGVDAVTFFYFERQNYTLCLWREQLGIQLDLRRSECAGETHWFSV